MSSFSFTTFCREPLKHNNILLSSAKFTLDQIQDVTLDFSIPFFNESNVASREKKLCLRLLFLKLLKKLMA